MNQSFNDQLNSIQILEQLAPLQLTKDHLPGDIIDILERLGKANHISHNQLYYIAENCANHYYSKVIETFMSLLKQQFADRQLLLINTARSLKFLEEYADRQALIWQIFRKHENIPDDISNLHLHITKINQVPYQTIEYNENGMFTIKLMNDTPIEIFFDNGATPSILLLYFDSREQNLA